MTRHACPHYKLSKLGIKTKMAFFSWYEDNIKPNVDSDIGAYLEAEQFDALPIIFDYMSSYKFAATQAGIAVTTYQMAIGLNDCDVNKAIDYSCAGVFGIDEHPCQMMSGKYIVVYTLDKIQRTKKPILRVSIIDTESNESVLHLSYDGKQYVIHASLNDTDSRLLYSSIRWKAAFDKLVETSTLRPNVLCRGRV